MIGLLVGLMRELITAGSVILLRVKVSPIKVDAELMIGEEGSR
jgi:hypothetical protein